MPKITEKIADKYIGKRLDSLAKKAYPNMPKSKREQKVTQELRKLTFGVTTQGRIFKPSPDFGTGESSKGDAYGFLKGKHYDDMGFGTNYYMYQQDDGTLSVSASGWGDPDERTYVRFALEEGQVEVKKDRAILTPEIHVIFGDKEAPKNLKKWLKDAFEVTESEDEDDDFDEDEDSNEDEDEDEDEDWD